jgi:uncharacterized protein YciI
MLYVVIANDVPNSLELRKNARPAHVARLQVLQDEGRLILAGPCPAVEANDPGLAGFTGSIIVAEFANLISAQTWANDDPYLKAGVYQQVTVKPFKKTFPT